MPEKWPFLATLRMYSQPTACDRLVSAIDEFVNDANETERTLMVISESLGPITSSHLC